MHTDDIRVRDRFRVKFKRVYLELQSLDSKIHKKSGFLFFKSHVYTIENLLDSPHHQRVFSITEKIGDDINNWHKSGKLTEIDEEVYFFERDKVDFELNRINLAIEDREPTWWEEIKEPLIEYIEIILNNLPEKFKKELLMKYMKKLLPFFKKIPRLILRK